jgi:sugar/nucleoside kinase (ribokinase family)
MYLDICDPTKRRQSELRNALKQISRFHDFFDVTLGLNESEAMLVAQALGVKIPRSSSEGSLATLIRQELGIRVVTIHRTKSATACEQSAGRERIEDVEGFFTPDPYILTGGGDHYNAGFCLGILNNWSLKSRLLLGVATSGSYVRTGTSPDVSALLLLIQKHQKAKE